MEYKFINSDKLDDKYAVSVTSLSKDKVSVSGTTSNLEKIETVCALIDVSDKTKAFTQTCSIKAYDSSNKEVKCIINPSEVIAKCSVDSYSKIVAIKPTFKGTVSKGYKISTYTLSPSTVKIYGDRSAISEISSISCEVDVSDLSGSTKLTGLLLEQNDKISKMSVTSISIDIVIEKE